MRLVIIESPYKGKNQEELDRNKRYLRACIRDCINRDESPYASHRMLTDALDDNDPVERAVGIKAGLAWRDVRQTIRRGRGGDIIGLDLVRHVFYIDLAWSDGMLLAKAQYDVEGILHEERKLPADDPFFVEPVVAAVVRLKPPLCMHCGFGRTDHRDDDHPFESCSLP